MSKKMKSAANLMMRILAGEDANFLEEMRGQGNE
jgi:hypothetical protein